MFPEIREKVRLIYVFLKFVWSPDFFGDPISISTAWAVAKIIVE